ncbi:glycoside hydrolase family 15 protein [Mycobacterium sp. pUA109]|uniref:glycoside hydrolase family 15 protein n=1 Tax=Mycobacterium sp. pUA109 TaxID=3238982 RepID=UPI00351B1364
MARDDRVDLLAAFPPQVLRQYALLADGERGALIGPHGEVTWLCAPRWDSDAVFATLIGGGGGYTVTPKQGRHVWGGYYEPGSLIWHSHWVTNDGEIECREALAFPADTSRVVVLRRIVAVRGTADVTVMLEPRAGFGHYASGHLACHDGVWTGRSGPLRWRFAGCAAARPLPSADSAGAVLVAELCIPEGDHQDLVFEVSERELPAGLVDPDLAWEATANAWSRHRPNLADTIAPHDATQAWAVLRGLTSSSGGMVAAATTSLPERAYTNKNYDYRYVWIRDQCYAGLAAAVAGASDLFDAATEFVTARVLDDGPHLKPAYTVSGGPVPDESTLDLPGYPGGTDKTGNGVNNQFQLDALGDALQLLATAARTDRLPADGWRAIDLAAAAIDARWREAEAGIWELGNRNWTHSRLTCVAGLRAVAGLSDRVTGLTTHAVLADAILAETARGGLHPNGYWRRSPELGGVDAALVLPAVRGAVPADDPRTLATVAAVREQLAVEQYVYRFRHDERKLGEAEGAFLLCGFMMALAEHQQGNDWAAVRYFERNRSACGPAGLFSEEYDVSQRQLRGNLPQACVHALMLETAATLNGSGSLSHRD